MTPPELVGAMALFGAIIGCTKYEDEIIQYGKEIKVHDDIIDSFSAGDKPDLKVGLYSFGVICLQAGKTSL